MIKSHKTFISVGLLGLLVVTLQASTPLAQAIATPVTSLYLQDSTGKQYVLSSVDGLVQLLNKPVFAKFVTGPVQAQSSYGKIVKMSLIFVNDKTSNTSSLTMNNMPQGAILDLYVNGAKVATIKTYDPNAKIVSVIALMNLSPTEKAQAILENKRNSDPIAFVLQPSTTVTVKYPVIAS